METIIKRIRLLNATMLLLLGGALTFITGCGGSDETPSVNADRTENTEQENTPEEQDVEGDILGTVTAKIETNSGDIIDYKGKIIHNAGYNMKADWVEVNGEASGIVVVSRMVKDGKEYNLNISLNFGPDGVKDFGPDGIHDRKFVAQNQSSEATDNDFASLGVYFEKDKGESVQYSSGSWSDNKDPSGSMGNCTIMVNELTHQKLHATFSGLVKEYFAAGKEDQGILKVTDGVIDTQVNYQLLKESDHL